MLRLVALLAVASNVGLFAQSTNQALMVTRIYNITPSWAGECAPMVLDNRSSINRLLNYYSYHATGSGTWSVDLQFSDVACSGPWGSFGSSGQVTQASATGVGSGSGFHPFIRFVMAGVVSLNFSGEKDFFIAPGGSGGGGGGGGSCPAEGTQTIVPFSPSPTFNLSTATSFFITLSGTVTSPVIIGIAPSCKYQVYICQDGSGNHTFAWPSNVVAPMSAGLFASKCSLQSFWATDASHLAGLGPGILNF